ncbi:RNA polymerase sigma factor [Nocardia takedensis]|uniref:RNA polymerase sigma factor n=1 Tax=Nocardia takedensis TaxID=259390 RepID=UPI003F769542
MTAQGSPSRQSAWESLRWSKQIEALFRQHSPGVYRFALRGLEGDTEHAKDIVQQVFLDVCRQYESDFHCKSENRQVKLIMTIARRRVIDSWRKTERETLCGDIEDLDRPQEDSFESPRRLERSDRILEDPQLRRLWESLTHDLTQTEYRVALMTWEMGLSIEHVARTLHTTPSAVRTHRSRAKRKMKQALVQLQETGEGGDGI